MFINFKYFFRRRVNFIGIIISVFTTSLIVSELYYPMYRYKILYFVSLSSIVILIMMVYSTKQDIESEKTRIKKITQTHISIEKSQKKITEKQSVFNNDVFIVHGHDRRNLQLLDNLLRERWNLKPIMLSETAGKGRTIIEKFEEEAKKTSFAFVLMTPDDQIEKDNNKYMQARPNVIFELGWFYGRLGRNKVCILFKKGTNIHSDLNGINRIDFEHSVEESIDEIEKELKAAGLLSI